MELDTLNYGPVGKNMTPIEGSEDFDGGKLDEVVVTGKRPQKKGETQVDTNLSDGKTPLNDADRSANISGKKAKDKPDYKALDALKGKETKVNPEDEKALKAILENDDALFKKFLGTRLEGDVKKKIAEIIKDIDPNRIKVIYEKLNPEQRANLEMLFEKVKLDSDAEKIREINKMIDKTKIELNYLDESVHTEQAGYKAQNLRREKQLEVNNHGDLEMSGKITEEELKSLNKILDGDTLIEEKFNKFEKSLKSDFRKAINILKDHTSLTELLAKFSAQSKAKNGMPDWQTLIPSYHFSDKEIKKIQKGYEAYLAANIGNPETSRWNEVIDALETGLLNEGKSLGVVVKETVNEPISKKERKLGLKKEKESWKSKNRKDMNYDVQKEGYIQKLEKQGWSKADATNAAEKRIEEQQNKDWKKYLKEQEKLGNQKSDLGKFSVLTKSIENRSPAEKITALLTDTNFDGIRNRLDGRGTKRGNQIDQALIMAQSPDNGKPLNMDQISANIIAYLDKRGTKWGSDKPTNAETFANRLAADINNAKLVQVALMDSPVEAVDIMKYGVKAMAKTLENHGLTPEEKKALEDKINTDPATKELSEEARETLMANLSGHLLAKMKEPGINASVNGLGVGVNMPLDQVLKGLSLSLGTGATLEGQPFAGVSFAWNDEVLKWKTGNASIGINAGTNLGVIPVYGFRGGIEQDLNAKKVLGSVDPTALQKFSAGANLTMIGAIPSYGVSVGFEKNQLRGIEKQYQYIKKEFLPITTKLLTKDKDGKYPDIATELQKLYPESTSEEIAKATDNLTTALNMAKDLKNPQEAAAMIAEWYADSWKNNATHGLPKGWKFTGASVGIQFFAGFFPIGSLSATLTKYKNLSHEDSPESKARLKQKIDSGLGDQTKNNVEKSDFDYIQKQFEASNLLKKGEKIQMNDKGEVTFPESLLSKVGLQVRINPELKGFVKSKDGQITLPAGVDYRFLKEARTNGTMSVFDIGYKQGEKMGALTPDCFGELDYTTTQHIESLKALIKPEDGLSIEAGKLYQTTNNDKKEIGILTKDSGIKIDQDGKVSITAEKGKFTRESKLTPLSVNNELMANVNALFKDIEGGLAKMGHDGKKFDKLQGFLKNTKTEKVAYLDAADELTKMFGEKYSEIKKALVKNTENTDFENPALAYQVMDRLKAIFATVPESQKNTKQAVSNLVKQRDTEFRKYHQGNSALKAFGAGDFDYVSLANGLSDAPESRQVDNLIGFTAFYRRRAGEARGMSMTAFGQTNVLDKTFPVEEGKQAEAKTWLIANINKYAQQKKMIAESIGKIEGATEGITQDGYLSENSLMTLLEKGSLDIGNKKIILKSHIVKYFLAECANESLGLQIDGVQIVDSEQAVQKEGSMTFNLGETIAKAHVEASRVTVGVAFGGGKKDSEKPGTTPGEKEVPGTTPGEKEVPGITPGEKGDDTSIDTPPTGDKGQDTEETGGRD